MIYCASQLLSWLQGTKGAGSIIMTDEGMQLLHQIERLSHFEFQMKMYKNYQRKIIQTYEKLLFKYKSLFIPCTQLVQCR